MDIRLSFDDDWVLTVFLIALFAWPVILFAVFIVADLFTKDDGRFAKSLQEILDEAADAVWKRQTLGGKVLTIVGQLLLLALLVLLIYLGGILIAEVILVILGMIAYGIGELVSLAVGQYVLPDAAVVAGAAVLYLVSLGLGAIMVSDT